MRSREGDRGISNKQRRRGLLREFAAAVVAVAQKLLRKEGIVGAWTKKTRTTKGGSKELFSKRY